MYEQSNDIMEQHKGTRKQCIQSIHFNNTNSRSQDLS